MSFLEWSKSSVDYGRRLADSAVEGARTGEDAFLKDEPLVPYLGESVRLALAPAFIGARLAWWVAIWLTGAAQRRELSRAVCSGEQSVLAQA
jgi:hypothetical protein